MTSICADHGNLSLDKGTKCILINLISMSAMNGELCKIVGSYRAKDERYPVYVYKTKEIALIKPENLKLVRLKSTSTINAKSKSYKKNKHRNKQQNKLSILPPLKGKIISK